MIPTLNRLMKNNPELWDELLTAKDYAPLFEKYPKLRLGPFIDSSRILSEILNSNQLIQVYPQKEVSSLEILLNQLSQNSSAHPLRSDKTFIKNFQELIEAYNSFKKLAPLVQNTTEYNSFNPSFVTLRFFEDVKQTNPSFIEPVWSQYFKDLNSFQKDLTTSEALANQRFVISLLENYLQTKQMSESFAAESINKLQNIGNYKGALTFAKLTKNNKFIPRVYEQQGLLNEVIIEYENISDYRSAVRIKQKNNEDPLAMRDYALKHNLTDIIATLHKSVIDRDINFIKHNQEIINDNLENDFISYYNNQFVSNSKFGDMDFSDYIIDKLSDNPYYAFKVASLLDIDKNKLIALGRAAAVSDREIAKYLNFSLFDGFFAEPEEMIGVPRERDLIETYLQRGETTFDLDLINLAVTSYRSAYNLVLSWSNQQKENIEERLNFLEKIQKKEFLAKRHLFKKRFSGKTEEEIAKEVGFNQSYIKPFANLTNFFDQMVYIRNCQKYGEEALDLGLLNKAIIWYTSAYNLLEEGNIYFEPIKNRLQRLQKLQKKCMETPKI